MALEFRQEDYLLWGNLADAYYWIPNEREKSFETYRRAVELAEGVRSVNPSDPKVLSHLADYYMMLSDRSQAMALLRQLVPLVGDDPELMFSVAYAYETMGDRAQALDWMAKALGAGYSPKLIASVPGLEELRADERFQLLIRRN